MFSTLTKLEVLSVAYNRLGDEGCSIIMDSIMSKMSTLKVFDASYTFLGQGCIKSLTKLMSGNTTPSPKKTKSTKTPEPEGLASYPSFNPQSKNQLKVLILQGHSLKNEVVNDLKKYAGGCQKRIVTEGLHVGIDVSIKYEQLYSDDITKVHDNYDATFLNPSNDNKQSGDNINLNSHITKEFEKMLTESNPNEDDYNRIYYKRCIDILKTCEKITDISQVSG